MTPRIARVVLTLAVLLAAGCLGKTTDSTAAVAIWKALRWAKE